MRTTPVNKDLTIDVAKDIQFSNIFNLVDIQRLQDLFSDATGVASIITHPDGVPITKISNSCRLCNDIIRKTKKGLANCYQSDAVLGRHNSSGPIVQPCLSGGLWDAGASISVGGKHIANWLIGQVRNEELDEKRMIQYADEIGADRADFMEALKEVSVMSVQQFKKVSKMLFEFANELSEKAFSNLQLKMQISESKQTELLLKEKNKQIETQKEKYVQINKELVFQNEEKEKRAAELIIANKELAIQNEEKEKRAAALIIANKELAIQNEEKEKRAAELIIANEHAQESDNLKTAFLNNISHEIRTPFNGILGFLSLIQEDDLTESERDEYIKIINKSAFRLMNTINDIVEISQIQAGQTKLSVSETKIQSLISGIYNHFKSDAASKELKFFTKNDLPANIDCIYTDNTKLNSILTILIGNAIKFTQTGSIEFGIKLKSDGDPLIGRVELEFSVKDTGISIPENKQQAIFERFMQADGSNTRLFEGSGIGLSIAKAYVEMLGGNIRVKSEEGKGAEFYFTIPCNYEVQGKNVSKTVELADVNENLPIHPLKILIAEDDEISGKLIEIAVKIFGTEVLKARTGIKAVEICRNNPDIDFVLMDIKMPEMDGYEATRQIRKFNTDVVIIAQTSHALTGDKERALAAGCNDYVSKPFSQALLTSLMKKHLKKQEKE